MATSVTSLIRCKHDGTQCLCFAKVQVYAKVVLWQPKLLREEVGAAVTAAAASKTYNKNVFVLAAGQNTAALGVPR